MVTENPNPETAHASQNCAQTEKTFHPSRVPYFRALELQSPKWENENPIVAENIATARQIESLANVVAFRLANPINRKTLDRKATFLPGSNGRKKLVRNDGNLRGYAERQISEHDFSDILGCVALGMYGECVTGNEDDTWINRANPETLTFETWKAIFSLSRSTLRMNRKVERENLSESLDALLTATDFHSHLTLSTETLAEFAREKREENDADAFTRKIIASQVKFYVSAILAANRADASRKAKNKKRTALAYLRKATLAMLGNGHGESYAVRFNSDRSKGGRCLSASHNALQTFRDYIADGVKQIETEKTAAAIFESRIAENALLYAVSE